MTRVLTFFGLVTSLILSSASSCDDETVAGSNNLDRPTDLLLIEEGEGGDSYVIIANPRAKTLRFFNVTDGLFEPAPNLAFPLATIIGSGTRSLAQTPNNTSLLFALDTTLAEVYTIQTRSNAQQAFTHARAPFRTQSSPNQLAVFQDGSDANPWDLWIASHTPPQIQRYSMTADELEVSKQGTITLEASVNQMAIGDDGQFAYVGLAALENNLQIIPRTATEQKITLSVPFVIQELKLGAMAANDTSYAAIWLLSEGGQKVGLVVFDPNENVARYLGAAEAPVSLQTFYLPKESIDNTCCDGLASELKSDQWFSTIDTEGNLFYWKWSLEGDSIDTFQLDLQLFDSNQATPTAEMSCTDASGESKPDCGEITLAMKEASDAPWDNWVLDGHITWVYEGAPNGLKQRPVIYNANDDVFTPVYGSFPLVATFLAGDEVGLSIVSESESCTGDHKLAFESMTPSTLQVGLMDNALINCLADAQTIAVSLRPIESFSLRNERHGTLQTVRLVENSWTASLGQWRTTLTSAPPTSWERGDEIHVLISSAINTVGMYLAQNFSYQTGGFGTFGNYAVAMVGGAVKIKNSEGEINDTRRVYLLTETGSLFEFTEGETDLTDVLSYK